MIIFGTEENKESVMEKRNEHDLLLVRNIGEEVGVVDLKEEKIFRIVAADRRPRPMK